MPCQTCNATADVEVCLFCGLSFCPLHRGEQGGVPACTGCLKAEHARKQKATSARAAERGASAAQGTSAAPARAREDADGTLQLTSPSAPPPPPAPEPKGWAPVLWAAGATLPVAAYLHWFLPWLCARHPDLPSWLPSAGLAAGCAFTAFGVWAIAKSR